VIPQAQGGSSHGSARTVASFRTSLLTGSSVPAAAIGPIASISTYPPSAKHECTSAWKLRARPPSTTRRVGVPNESRSSNAVAERSARSQSPEDIRQSMLGDDMTVGVLNEAGVTVHAPTITVDATSQRSVRIAPLYAVSPRHSPQISSELLTRWPSPARSRWSRTLGKRRCFGPRIRAFC